MRAGAALSFPATHRSFAKPDRRAGDAHGDTGALEARPGQDEETSEAVLVELFDGVDQIAIERETQATSVESAGVKRRVTLRRSVSVQPNGGVIRSACSIQSEYPTPASMSGSSSSSHTALSE